MTFICKGKKAKTGPKTMDFRLKKIPEPVKLILSDKTVIFAQQNLLAFEKTPLFSMKWREQKNESKRWDRGGDLASSHICHLAKLGAPHSGPVVFNSIFGHTTSSKKGGFFFERQKILLCKSKIFVR